jgi:hypothetical protein
LLLVRRPQSELTDEHDAEQACSRQGRGSVFVHKQTRSARPARAPSLCRCSIMKRMLRRSLIGFVGHVCLAATVFIAFIFYGFYAMMPPFNRVNEKLPSVAVENGNTVYCRMRYCDFRLPSPGPERAHLNF